MSHLDKIGGVEPRVLNPYNLPGTSSYTIPLAALGPLTMMSSCCPTILLSCCLAILPTFLGVEKSSHIDSNIQYGTSDTAQKAV